MNKQFINIISCFTVWLMACSFSASYGQQLDSLIELSWKNSSKVKALEAEFLASKTIGNQLNSYPDPEISLGVGLLPVETRLGPQRLRLGATQMIPWPGLLEAKQALAEAMADVKSVAADNYMVEVAFQIKKAYYDLHKINKKIDLYDQQIQYMNTLKELATTRIESGDARLSDVLKIESRIIEMEGMKQQLVISSSIPAYVINRFTGRPLSTPVRIENDLKLPELESFGEMAVADNHPQLTRLEKMKEASHQAISLTGFQSKPKIGVGLDYIMVGQRTDALPDGNGRDIIMPMGKISIPLNQSTYEYKRQEERLKLESIDHLKNDFKEEGSKEIETSLNMIAQAIHIYTWNNKVINNNNTTIDLIRTAYTSSEASIEELLELYIDNIRREQTKIDALINAHFAKARMEKYQTSTTF